MRRYKNECIVTFCFINLTGSLNETPLWALGSSTQGRGAWGSCTVFLELWSSGQRAQMIFLGYFGASLWVKSLSIPITRTLTQLETCNRCGKYGNPTRNPTFKLMKKQLVTQHSNVHNHQLLSQLEINQVQQQCYGKEEPGQQDNERISLSAPHSEIWFQATISSLEVICAENGLIYIPLRSSAWGCEHSTTNYPYCYYHCELIKCHQQKSQRCLATMWIWAIRGRTILPQAAVSNTT